jgi:HSP20 family protein
MNSTQLKANQFDWERLIETEPLVKPVIDIIENVDDYIVKVYMPGVSKENIFLKLEDDILTIFGKVDLNHIEDERFLLREKSYGHYFRQLTLSDKIDTSKIEAKLENGLLNIILPKQESLKPKVISIN